MITDESLMQEMLERATNPTKDSDESAVQMFCMVVRQCSKQQVEHAQKCLLLKIQSKDEVESKRAITLLEEAMAQCGPDFQDEVGKFRFLNELIRLVSKNHQGADTPIPIKKRIMECLLLWTTLYPQKTKIRDVYDMLKKEGVVEHGPESVATFKNRESILGKDDDLFNELIQSGDQENFKRANLLVQARVNQEIRRNEFIFQQKSCLQEIENTVGLLNQMLDTFLEEGGVDEDGSDTMNLIRELYLSCKKHKAHLERLKYIESMDSNLLADTLETNDMVQNVLQRYKNIVVHRNGDTKTECGGKSVSKNNTDKSNTDLLTELLSNTDLEQASSIPANLKSDPMGNMDAKINLHEIDDLLGDQNVIKGKSEKNSILEGDNPIFGMSDILDPISVFPKRVEGEKIDVATPSPEKRHFYPELREIDQLSEQLFKEILPSRDRFVNVKLQNEKPSLNDLCKEKIKVKLDGQPAVPIVEKSAPAAVTDNVKRAIDTLSLDEPILSSSSNRESEDDVMLIKSENIPSQHDEQSSDNQTIIPLEQQQSEQSLPHKHLSDITIDLDDIIPTAEEHLLLNDDDIKVTLNFTENRPSPNVIVIVISVLNKSKLPIKDFQFEASTKKPNKVRLLQPSDTVMPPYKPFRPPMPINQVMLLLNTTGKPVDVTCIVGYKLGDDPDPIKESIVAKDIPFVELPKRQ